MSAARTGLAAPSTRKQTDSISIPTQLCFRCRTSPWTSRCQARRTLRQFCVPPPNQAKTKRERPRGRAEVEVAQALALVVPEDPGAPQDSAQAEDLVAV